MKKIMMSVFFCFLISNLTTALAYTQTVTPIVRDVDLIKIIKSTKDGDQNITVVRANLNNPNIALKTLFSSNGSNVLANVKTLADENMAIAAVNGDFFSWGQKGGTGSAIGYNVVNGEIITTPCITENVASVATNKQGEHLFAYFEREMKITTPDGVSEQIKHINKYDDLSGINLYDSSWGKYSLGSNGNLIEVVVEDDIIKEIRKDQPAALIPQNGYILAGLSDVSPFLTESINVGDKLSLDIKITPDFDAVNAIGGGTILVTDGMEAKITHNISGRQPRSAFGVDKTGKIIYLITVDGRNAGGSIGMTLQELREFMIEYGIYNGINFDGGGSTQMVIRPLGEKESTIINTPTENRKVINALGIISNGKAGIPDMIQLKTEMSTMFAQTKISVSAQMYDQVYNTMDSDIEINLAGVEGEISDGLLYPTSAGTAVITAKSDGLRAETKVRVLQEPQILKVNSDSYYLNKGERKAVTLTGYTNEGEMVYINPFYAKMSQTNPILKSIDGGFEALSAGTTTITYSLGNAKVSATAYVEGDEIIEAEYNNQTDRFEQTNGSVYLYPPQVSGAYKISDEKAKNGRTSGKLWYDFLPEMDAVGSVGINFHSPMIISDPNSNIKADVYASRDNKQWLRFMLTDANGELHRLDLAKEINWNGWKTVNAKIPDEVVLPAKLTRIYLVQPDKNLRTKGAVYFDNLTVSTKASISITAGIDEDDKILINRLSDMWLENELNKSGLSFNFKKQKSNRNVKMSRNGIALFEFIDYEWLNSSVKSADENTIVIVAEEKPDKEKIQPVISGLKDKTLFIVYNGDESIITTEDGINYVSLKAIKPSVSRMNKTVSVFNLYITDGNIKYQIDDINLW